MLTLNTVLLTGNESPLRRRKRMRRGLGLVLAAALIPSFSPGAATATVSQNSIITTIAGRGQTPGFSGDGGQAEDALLKQPRDSEIGPDGSLYIADTNNNRIRRIWPDGTITTVAGTGAAGYNGDGIRATKARLYWPHDVFVDDVGNLFIADSNNQRIRQVTTDGVIHTIAGTGQTGSSGDGGLATKARLNHPKSVFLSGGYLYTSGLDNKVRRINMSTDNITTYAGTGASGYVDGPRATARFSHPQRVQVDSSGNVFVADSNNSVIRRIDAGSGKVTTVAGTGVDGYNGASGAATTIQLNRPRGIVVEGNNLLYIADSNNHRIRQLNLGTGRLETIAGLSTRGYSGDGGPCGKAAFYQPRGLTIDAAGNLIIADTFNSVIRMIAHS